MAELLKQMYRTILSLTVLSVIDKVGLLPETSKAFSLSVHFRLEEQTFRLFSIFSLVVHVDINFVLDTGICKRVLCKMVKRKIQRKLKYSAKCGANIQSYKP